MQPGIETAEMDIQNAAHDSDLELLLVSPDEAIRYSDSFAKNAAVSSTGQCKYALQLFRRCQVVECFPRSFIQLPCEFI